MVDQQLNPSIQQFKQFINQYPEICKDIHSGKVDIQTLYEKWVVVGEDDPYWLTYHEESESTTSDLIQTIISATENMDVSKVQTYVEQVSSAVDSVQEVLQQFNTGKKSSSSFTEDQPSNQNFFQWMRD